MKNKNPLYAAWKKMGLVRDPWGGWREPMRDLRTDADTHAAVMELGSIVMSRKSLVRRYAWAIPSTAAIKWIAERCPEIIEIGAGRGYWAMLLANAGVDILAFDQAGRGQKISRNPYHYIPQSEIDQKLKENPEAYRPFESEFVGQTDHAFYPVQFGRAKIAAEHPDRTLMLCWPPYSSPFANDCLKYYHGQQVLFIGEHDGATGSKAFFNRLDRDWQEIGECSIPQWIGMHDAIWLYQRK